MLNLQAKSYGIEEERMVHLEKWYEQEKISESVQHINLSEKYGDSGINLMSVFGTTGEAPIDEKEIKKSFTSIDMNKDGVISPNEFSNSPEVSKLPDEYREEMFSEIDLNKDGLLQYEEFRAIAQITESQILSESNIQDEKSEMNPSVKQQWTDEAGHTWRLMDDDSTMWWNGTDWQHI